jgi:hypothetical protein
MPLSEVAACYRLYAVYCAELAQNSLEPGRKVALLNMAQAWVRLADQVERDGDDLGFVSREQSSHHE